MLSAAAQDSRYWSRHAPGNRPRSGNTDHWSKMKTAKTFRMPQLPTGMITVLCAPQGPVLEKRKRRHTVDVGEISSLSRTGNRGLHQELFLTVPTLTQQQIQGMQNQLTHRKRERPQSAYYERARQGFRFWTEDKPRPVTPSVKNTLGSKGSFLGLGVPRL